MEGEIQSTNKNILDAYISRNAAKAKTMNSNDYEVDALHTNLFQKFFDYMTKSRAIYPHAHI